MVRVKSKRGRPSRDVLVEILRKLNAVDLALIDAMRNRGGRPAKHDLNKAGPLKLTSNDISPRRGLRRNAS